MRKLLLFSLLCMLLPVAAAAAPEGACDGVTVGAADTAAYFPLLRGRRVAVLANQTSRVGDEHLVDLLHSRFESLIAGAAPEAIMEWAAVDIGLRARLVRAVGRSMLARRFGRCVFVSSSAAECPAEGQGYYAAAKLAGEALYRSLAVELSGRGVTACSLRLSWLDAGRGAVFLERRREAVEKRMPIGRLVRMDEAVETVLFLLSASASSVNGTVVTLDGGLSATKTTF